MKRIVLPVFLLAFVHTMHAQLERPVLLCDSVNLDGSVTLVWERISDPGNIFTAYSVFYRPNPASTFSLVTTVTDIDQVTYRHIDAAANDRSRFYFIRAESTEGPSESSDTLETIFLYFETDDNEHITLYWNALHDPPWPTPDVRYLVYREYPPGNWELLTNTQDLTFDHHFWFCNKNQYIVNFQVFTQDISTGCQSCSNISASQLSNVSQPDMPLMDSVSITSSGESVLGWQPATAPDIAGYIIYRVTTINDSIAFVPGIESSFFMDNNANPCEGPISYAIASIDSCGNKSPGTFSTPHQTIYLQDIEYDACLLTNTLRWNPYKNFDPPLGGYQIHASIDGGDFFLLDNIPPGDTVYVHASLAPNTHYAYFIRAYSQSGGKTSTSCIRELTTYNSPFPQFMYLRYVSVNEGDEVDLSFLSDTAAHVLGYKVYRGDNLSALVVIDSIPPSGSEILFYTDQEAETNLESYYYRISVIDSCNNEYFIANTSRTIFLQVESNEDLTNVLTWNEYESWDGGVEGYRVYRRIGDDSPAQQIGGTQPGELTFPDDISSLSGTGGRIGYYVEAFEGPGNHYGFSEIARSNEVLADVPETVFVPNAFAPNGLNSTLKPVGSFISDENYIFNIYNRWGQLIYESAAPTDAWDGTFNGKMVSQDVYVYILRFTTATGEVIVRKGTVAVIF